MKKVSVFLILTTLIAIAVPLMAMREEESGGCGPRDPHSHHEGFVLCYNTISQACGTGCGQ